jgi:hypothetical protein
VFIFNPCTISIKDFAGFGLSIMFIIEYSFQKRKPPQTLVHGDGGTWDNVHERGYPSYLSPQPTVFVHRVRPNRNSPVQLEGGALDNLHKYCERFLRNS